MAKFGQKLQKGDKFEITWVSPGDDHVVFISVTNIECHWDWNQDDSEIWKDQESAWIIYHFKMARSMLVSVHYVMSLNLNRHQHLKRQKQSFFRPLHHHTKLYIFFSSYRNRTNFWKTSYFTGNVKLYFMMVFLFRTQWHFDCRSSTTDFAKSCWWWVIIYDSEIMSQNWGVWHILLHVDLHKMKLFLIQMKHARSNALNQILKNLEKSSLWRLHLDRAQKL